MAKGQKPIPWTQAEEAVLLKNIEKNVFSLSKAFKQTSLEIQRTPVACQAHWYDNTSVKSGKVLFLTVAGTEVLVNRTRKGKKAATKPATNSLFSRILKMFGL